MKKFLIGTGVSLFALAGFVYFLSLRSTSEPVQYGVTFSTIHATDIGLDWRAVYKATLDELNVRRIRIAAYWPQIEKERDVYSWDDLDFQIKEAEKRNAEVIVTIGRRLPRWPECHVPEWAKTLSWEEQKDEIREQVRAVVERYKNEQSVLMWQVENEPFLTAFATEHCGWLDEEFLAEEVALVRSLDDRPILMTDGGNFGLWYGAYRLADVFGTSMYLYFWHPDVGAFKTVLPPVYYRAKANLLELVFGEKPIILSELSLEPWLAAHVDQVSLDEQRARMPIERMTEILDYASHSSFSTRYVWGVEWWYWMRERGYPEYWNAARGIFMTE